MSKKDCWMLDICSRYDSLSATCKASDSEKSSLIHAASRCDSGTKTIITILASIDEKLNKLTSKD